MTKFLYAFRNTWMKKLLPFTKIDTSKIMPEVFIKIVILFFLYIKVVIY